jgi:tetratricopeptide (TPR) repeat protein
MSRLANFHTKHFVVIVLSLLVFVGLLFVDKTSLKSTKSNEVKSSDNRNSSNSVVVDESIKSQLYQLEKKLSNVQLASEKLQILDQLVSLSMNNGLIDYAVKYQKQIVEMNNEDHLSLQKLGDLALQAMDVMNLDSVEYTKMSQLALESFQKLKSIQREESTWSVKVAISKVKSRKAPVIMEGIRDLVEITQKNPNHFEANYYLGYFSLESNQPEKALKRFQKCIELQPQNPEVLIGLGESYRLLNQKEQAIKNYQEALKFSKNEVQKSKIQSKIELLNH